MKNKLIGGIKMKNVLKGKLAKVVIIVGVGTAIFGGGAVSAGLALTMFDTAKGENVMARVNFLGDKLMTEKSQRWFFQDEATDKQATIVTLNTSISGLNTDITELQTALDNALLNGSTAQQTEITALKAQIATLTAQKTALETEKASLLTDVQTLNAEVTEANISIDKANSKLAEYEALYNSGQRTNGTSGTSTWSGDVNGN